MDWNFSNTERGAEGPTANFINNVGELVSEHHDGLEQVWEAACMVCVLPVSACPDTADPRRKRGPLRSGSSLPDS
jgi:hypothetical protein